MSIRTIKKKQKKALLESAMMRDIHQAHIRMWWDESQKTIKLDVNMLADGRRTKVWLSRNFIKKSIE